MKGEPSLSPPIPYLSPGRRGRRKNEALAKRVVEEALAEGGGVKGAILALRAIEVADPAVEVTANVEAAG